MPAAMIGPPKGNNNKTYIVLAVVLGLIVLSVASCVAVVIRAGDQFVDAFESVADETQAAVDAVGFDTCGIDDGELSFTGTITNPRNIVSSFRFTVVFFDASGAQITQTEIVIPDLAPGETAPFSGRLTETISSDRFECEVSTMVIEPFRFGN